MAAPGCLPPHPTCPPRSCTHACSPSPGAPSSRGHTRGTGVLRSPAGRGTDRSGGDTRSPWQLARRHKGDSPGIAQSRSVLPVTHPEVNKPAQPWKQAVSRDPQRSGGQTSLSSIPPQSRPLPRSTSTSPVPLPVACPILGPTPSLTKQRSQRSPVTPALHRQRPLWGSQVSVPHGEQSHPEGTGGGGVGGEPTMVNCTGPIPVLPNLAPHAYSSSLWFGLGLNIP